MITPPTGAPRVRPSHNPAPAPKGTSFDTTPKLHFREQIQRLKSPKLLQNDGLHKAPPATKAETSGCEGLTTGRPACDSLRGGQNVEPEPSRLGAGLGAEPVDETLHERENPDEEQAVVENWCDPMARALLHWAAPQAVAASVAPAPAGVPPAILEQIASQLIRKVGVGPSSVHLQLGAGHLEGGEVLVQSGTDGLDVQVTAPVGVDGVKLGQAIHERLTKRGLRVARVVVD